MFLGLQHNLSGADELRVKPKYLQRKDNLVDDALSGRLLLGPKLKVARFVVGAIPVLVVDVLALAQRAAKHLFHNHLMLESLDPVSEVNPHVTRIRSDVPFFGNRTPLSVLPSAFFGTEFVRVVEPKPFAAFHLEAAAFRDLPASSANEGWRGEVFGVGALHRAVSLLRIRGFRGELLAALRARLRECLSHKSLLGNQVQIAMGCEGMQPKLISG